MSDLPSGDTERCRVCGGGLAEKPSIHGIDRLIGVAGEFDIRVCADCGSGTTFLIVPEDELGALYTGEYNPHATWAPPNKILAALQSLQKKYIEWQAMRSMPMSHLAGRGGRSLDVGCGRGDLAVRLQSRGWDALGIDPPPDAVETANALGVEAIIGTIGSIYFAERQFDAITFQHSLEHVYDPEADMKRTSELAAEEALILVSVPNFGSRQRRLLRSRWFYLDLPRHRYHYTSKGLRLLAERSGLNVVDIATSTSAAGLPGSIVYSIFGRWPFTNPLVTRAVLIGSLALFPVALLIDRFGGGDMLHLVAQKPPSPSS